MRAERDTEASYILVSMVDQSSPINPVQEPVPAQVTPPAPPSDTGTSDSVKRLPFPLIAGVFVVVLLAGAGLYAYRMASENEQPMSGAASAAVTPSVSPSGVNGSGSDMDSIGNGEMPSSANASPAAARDLDEEFLRKPTPSLGGEWVPVPADGRFVIAPFMVMKYEARYDGDTPGSTPVSGVEGLPATGMSRTAAMAACRTLGEGFSLISHSQWMALARNIESVPANWSGDPGYGKLKQGAIGPDNGFPPSGPLGVNDSSGLALRSHALTTGDTIYDLSGNVWEHVMDVFEGERLPYASPAADPDYYTFEYTAQVVDWGTTGKAGFGPERAWDSAQGIGTFTNTYPRSELQGKRFGLVYGGDFGSGAKNGGIYAASVVPEGDEGYAKGSTGFRCVYDGR